MTPYWLLFSIPVLFSLSPYRANLHLRALLLWMVALFLVLLIGFRYEIGGDWDAYLGHFNSVHGINLLEAMALNDPAYMTVNWLSDRLGFGIYGVNLVCGSLFTLGLVKFCRNQPLPWLALAVATPYLIIVVAMGYSRQGVALGFLFWGLSELQNKKTARFFILIVLGALFHKSAVVVLPLILTQTDKQEKMRAMLFVFISAVVAVVLVVDSIQTQWTNYVDAQMQSEGGGVRIWLNVLPAVFLIVCRKKWKALWPGSLKIWVWLGWGAVACIPLQVLASTATDRLALYIAPLQLAVYSRLPLMMAGHWRAVSLIGVLLGYGLVLYVWLNFSVYATRFWLPYKWMLF